MWKISRRKDLVGFKPHFVFRSQRHNQPVMASAYDEIKKVLAKIRQGEPITEQNRAELNRVREMLEQQLATSESQRNDLPPAMLERRNKVAKTSLAARKSSEP